MDILKSIKKQIQYAIKGKPWEALEKNFKLELQCEECGLPTNALFTVAHELNCSDCKDAKRRRALLKQSEEEWGEKDS